MDEKTQLRRRLNLVDGVLDEYVAAVESGQRLPGACNCPIAFNMEWEFAGAYATSPSVSPSALKTSAMGIGAPRG